MSVAELLEPIVRTAAGGVQLHLTAWDGSEAGPPNAPVGLTVHDRRALRRLLWAPNELGFARAYVAGEVDIDGDLVDTLTRLEALADPALGPGVHPNRETVAALARAVPRLRIIGPRPSPPPEEVHLGGVRHSRRRDAAAISHHYDVGNEFYEFMLGRSMTYSCAYWAHGDRDNLDHAQRAKIDLVAHKLGLRPGDRVLDVGCGWGTFARQVARDYGVSVIGVTLSHAQADWARAAVAADGLDGKVEIRVQDYRDVDDGPYDAIASIGMAEHVGAAQLPRYAERLHSLLGPGGRLLNHAIARRPGPATKPSRTSFIARYVFPDGELEPLATHVDALESAGFEVRDVHSLREHYGLTLRAWLANLDAHWDRAVELTSPGRARVWRLYLAGCVLAFEAGRVGVNQVLAVKPGPHGASGLPLSRAGYAG